MTSQVVGFYKSDIFQYIMGAIPAAAKRESRDGARWWARLADYRM
jgi:hypothetical protein